MNHEYSLVASASVVATVVLDLVLGTRLITRWRYWAFTTVMFFFTGIVNGYLTWRPIVLYNERMILGPRLGTIPIEDFLFCFSLITSVILVWELAGNRRKKKSSNPDSFPPFS
jgi:lycopene cyclase domain-containing protein